MLLANTRKGFTKADVLVNLWKDNIDKKEEEAKCLIEARAWIEVRMKERRRYQSIQ